MMTNPHTPRQAVHGIACCILTVFAAWTLVAGSEPLAAPVEVEPLQVTGRAKHGDSVSGVARLGQAWVLAPDEGAELLLLGQAAGAVGWSHKAPIRLDSRDVEIDLEGLAANGSLLYAAGSHSLKRRRIEPGSSRAANRERIETVIHEENRDRLYRLRFEDDGARLVQLDQVNLRALLAADAVLAPSSAIPGKENGLNIEGLAIDGDALRVGLRGPILREGHIAVLRLKFDEPDAYRTDYVQLDGRGIRGMTTVANGFLLLVGPAPYELMHWDGKDMGRLTSIGRVPTAKGARAEGVELLAETETTYEVVIVFDGPENGAPTRMLYVRP